MLASVKPLLPKITSIKVKSYNNAFSSEWIPITNADKNIQVILETELNFDNFKELQFENKIYFIKKNKLIESK